MAIPHSHLGSGLSTSFDSEHGRDHERRLLELQLTRLRSEALAARLEAQAAEVEIRLRCLVGRESDGRESDGRASVDIESTGRPRVMPPLSEAVRAARDLVPGADDVTSANDVELRADTQPIRAVPVLPQFDPVDSCPAIKIPLVDPVKPIQRSRSIKRAKPVMPAEFVKPAKPVEPAKSVTAAKSATAAKSVRPVKSVTTAKSVKTVEFALSTPHDPMLLQAMKPAVIAPLKPEEHTRRRSSPMAVVMSGSVHGLLLLVLALVSLKLPSPRDQVALSAAVDASEPEPLAAVTIESEQPQVDPVEPTQSDAKVQFDSTVPTSTEMLAVSESALTPFQSLLGSSSAAVASASLQVTPASGKKMTFCGVEGGGNHFVYLVDCSHSMGSAFESARAELIQSIEALKPDQRFYVIFFDERPDYMRITNPDEDESESVLATTENKQALARWAMRVQMDSGKAPYEPLKFALDLAPDVIFLLSDGEFPAGIERLLGDNNRVENLFGDQQMRSIVHTIGYHSQQGEARMRSIAQQNQGQYRHVPKPVVPKSP